MIDKKALIDSLVIIHPESSPAIIIDMPYCDATHPENVFGMALSKEDAPFILTEQLAEIVLDVAYALHEEKGWYLCLKDGLRPTESQALMNQSPLVQKNPHWANVLISQPGQGAHPRGCAVDVTLLDEHKKIIDMGTAFDYFSTDLDNNPAARDYKNLSSDILEKRAYLTHLFETSAKELELPIFPLPSEWWDYRFPLDQYKDFPALSNDDLPNEYKML